VKHVELTDSCGNTLIVFLDPEDIRLIRQEALVFWRPQATMLHGSNIEYRDGNSVFVRENIQEILRLMSEAVC